MSTSLDKVGFSIAQNIYTNAPRTVAAACSAWVATHAINKIAPNSFDPKVTMLFTAMTSLLYYATQSLSSTFGGSSKTHNLISRALVLLGLTKVSTDKLKLKLPLYKEFAKTSAVAGALIAFFDKADQYLPGNGTSKKTRKD